jgi:NAD(P)-dependent dehydrogenase (short-subunit alcohol dehydrogenase family)
VADTTEQGLTGRTALVTGAGRGIGRATAVALAGAGVARIALVARTAAQLDETARAVEAAGAQPVAITADLADSDSVRTAVEAAERQLGQVDILVNNAGTVAPLGATAKLDAADVLAALRLNVVAPILLAGAVAEGMRDRGWGRIVNVSSGVVARPGTMPGGGVYAATKAALEAQTVSMAAEYADTGVHINVYRPGPVDTAMQEWIRAQDPEAIGRRLHERFIGYRESGTLLTAEQSGAALVAHLVRREETGRIWDVTDEL